MSKNTDTGLSEEIRSGIIGICEKARIASRALAVLDRRRKDLCLARMAELIESGRGEILKANKSDVQAAEKKRLSSAMIDRLTLNDKRIDAMAGALRDIALLEDPVGRKLSSTVRPNGLLIDKVSVPIGVICIIYEARPNVTVDSAGLCLKAGNAVILRGGSESINSNKALARCLNMAAVESGLPDGAVQLVPWTDRAAVSFLLKMDSHVDLVMPRGGESLIRAVTQESTIPVIKHYKGICHVYVDEAYDMDMALSIVENAKCQRPGVCNAAETLLVHAKAAGDFCPRVAERLLARGVELRGDDEFRRLVPAAKPASEEDWFTEYLDMILSVRIVPDLDAAISHINFYGSRHSDAIVTRDQACAERFLREVDSAAVYVNASTRFTDGGEFGMGAEIGISTDKLHARGPMGLAELTTYKYMIYGNGQIRT